MLQIIEIAFIGLSLPFGPFGPFGCSSVHDIVGKGAASLRSRHCAPLPTVALLITGPVLSTLPLHARPQREAARWEVWGRAGPFWRNNN